MPINWPEVCLTVLGSGVFSGLTLKMLEWFKEAKEKKVKETRLAIDLGSVDI